MIRILATAVLGFATLLAALVTTPVAAAKGGTQDPPFTRSAVLETIQKRGVVRIGVKADFPLFGIRNAAGEVVGFEVDLAERIAKELGVRFEKVVVGNEDRFQKLEQGIIDITIATAFDTKERRQLATAIEPNYYGAGTTVMLRPEERAKDWQDIRGKTLCALQGAYFNRLISQRHIVKLDLYRSVRDALLALKDGRCIGYLHSEVSIAQYLLQPEWQGYKAPFTPAVITPWAISIPRSERGSELERLIGDIVADWHRSGFLIAKEKEWGIRPSKFLKDAQALWRQKTPQGDFICARETNGQWPIACRNPEFITSEQVDGVKGFGLWVRETLGINLSIVYDDYDSKRFLVGVLYTLLLSMGAILIAIALGFVGAQAALSASRWKNWTANIMGGYGRMTPPLLHMYLLFFGVGTLLWTWFGFRLAPFLVAIWCLGVYAGAQIMLILVDSARFLKVQRPDFTLSLRSLIDVVEHAATPVKGAIINLTKGTATASSLAVPEMLYATIAIIGDQGNVWVMMNVLLLIFFAFNAFWGWLFDWIEVQMHQRLKRSAK
jgi:polar amino acid transport system substrate-binding protein